MKELSKQYNPAEVESRIYKEWEDSGAFRPASDHDPSFAGKPYTIIMPPPNATSRLHTGHAIMLAIEDSLVRYHRMQGRDTLYVPGTDHAAIATASVIDRQLIEEGTDKAELGREAFAERAKKWALEQRTIIESQVRAMGASADWSRNAFTMDEKRETSVREAFKRLYEKDLIYRDDYMVNWCPTCNTVIADDEVEHEEREGVLYFMKYGPFELATTRPETKVGDTAVAVNPEDKRYTEWVGKEIEVQTINGTRKLKVIADKMVDPEFGTGVVKITPFHDKNDYETSRRHNLEAIEVIGEDGLMTEAAGAELEGLTIEAARTKMVAWLKANNLLVKEELIRHSVGTCYRSGDVVEPRISRQWFVRVSKLTEQAIKFADDGDLTIVPKRFDKIYRDWMSKMHDWCISRQIWFGHPLPAYLNEKGEVSLEPKEGFTPSPDTLDTWFSSALWPYSTLGWPEQTPDLERFFPSDVLETGYDIIFFWVARMVLMTIALDVRDKSGELKPPFQTVYLHGLVRDKRGRKFSKTLGNGVDPLELIEKYGADSLRMMLLTAGRPGSDINFDESQLIGSRNFMNKLWNIARYVLSKTPEDTGIIVDIADPSNIHAGILAELEKTAKEVGKQIGDYRLDLAARSLYDFTWKTFADVYIEESKQNYDANTALTVLDGILKMLHPFIPFVTEEIWSHMPNKQKSLIISEWPSYNFGAVTEAFAQLVSDRNNRDSQKRIAELELFVAELKKRLADSNFTTNAPKEVIAKQQEKLERAEEELKELTQK
jgi:valyl-tRNA synthetase